MKILFINQHAGSDSLGMEYRPYYLAKEWIKLGHEVTVIAADYTHLRKSNPIAASDFSEEYINGIRYVWLKCGVYSGNGRARVLSMLRFASKLYRNAKRIADKYAPDAVVTASTHPFDSYAGRRIANLSGAKYTHEVHDLWPMTLIELGGFSKYHPFILMMQKAEDYACRHCDALVSTLSNALSYMESRGLASGKFHYVNNGIYPELWNKRTSLPEDMSDKIENIRKKSSFLIGYAGGHASSNALDSLIRAAALLKDKGIHIILVGNGNEKENLKKLAKKIQADNVTFLDKVGKACIPDLLSRFDALYIGWKDSRIYSFGVSPNKIFDYMMAEKPIIHSINMTGDIVTLANCGIRVAAESPEEIAEGIRKLSTLTKDVLNEMGQNGKKYVLEHFDYKILAESYLEAISK